MPTFRGASGDGNMASDSFPVLLAGVGSPKGSWVILKQLGSLFSPFAREYFWRQWLEQRAIRPCSLNGTNSAQTAQEVIGGFDLKFDEHLTTAVFDKGLKGHDMKARNNVTHSNRAHVEGVDNAVYRDIYFLHGRNFFDTNYTTKQKAHHYDMPFVPLSL